MELLQWKKPGQRAGCAPHAHLCVLGGVWTGPLSRVLRKLYVVESKTKLLYTNAGSCWLSGASVVLVCVTGFHFVPCALKSEI